MALLRRPCQRRLRTTSLTNRLSKIEIRAGRIRLAATGQLAREMPPTSEQAPQRLEILDDFVIAIDHRQELIEIAGDIGPSQAFMHPPMLMVAA